MKKHLIICVALFTIISQDQLFAQGPAHLQVYKSSCNPGNEWSGWVNQSRPYFYYDFMAPYIMSEVTVTNVPYGGTYTQVYSINSGNFCNQWSESYALATGRYIWNVRVYFNAGGPIGWTWSQTTWGSDFYVDVTPPNPPVVTDNDCGGSHTGWPAWTTHPSPYFTWDNPGDIGCGVSYYQVSVNSGGWSNVSTLWHPTYEGRYSFDFRSVDCAGNSSSSYRLYVGIDNTFPPAPSVSEVHCVPHENWTSHTSPYFSWAPVFDPGEPINGSGINRFEVSINGGSWNSLGMVTLWEPTYGTGQYSFRFRSVDNVGLTSGSYSPIIVYIDDTPPDPPIVTELHCGGSTSENPPWSSHNSPYFTWSIPADAGSGVSHTGFQVSVNGGGWTSVMSIWHPVYANGSYTFDFRSVDGVGYTSTLYRLYVRIHTNTKIYVKQNATGANNGSSWTDAYTDLQSALSAALPNDTIWIAAGTYKPSVDKTGNSSPADPRTKTFKLVSNVPVYGGFAGTETKLYQRNLSSNESVLSGDIGAAGNSTDNSYCVVMGVNNITLDGFTITGGNGNGTGTLETYTGGGLLNNAVVFAKVRNCIFKNNYSKQGGGAGNYFCTDSLIFSNCKFFNNTSDNGGAIGNWNTRVHITNGVFAGNYTSSATSFGSAIYNWGSGSTSQIINCTFYNNLTSNSGGVIHNRGVASTATNCILWGNNSNDIVNSNGGGCSLTYSCIEQSGYAGSNGNISSNPQFLDALNGDFRLFSTSPCIDAGNGTTAPKLDFDSNSRFDNPTVTNTGTGVPAYSDIGAYECLLTTFADRTSTEDLILFPNPNNGEFTIEGGDIKQIEVYNFLGTLIYSRSNNLNQKINLGQQPKGVYFLKIRTGKKLIMKKLIIN